MSFVRFGNFTTDNLKKKLFASNAFLFISFQIAFHSREVCVRRLTSRHTKSTSVVQTQKQSSIKVYSQQVTRVYVTATSSIAPHIYTTSTFMYSDMFLTKQTKTTRRFISSVSWNSVFRDLISNRDESMMLCNKQHSGNFHICFAIPQVSFYFYPQCLEQSNHIWRTPLA